MSKKQTTVRLSDDHRDKLERIEDKYNLRSRNEAIEMVIDTFDLAGDSADDSLASIRQAVETQQEDIEAIKHALSIDTPDEASVSASSDEEVSETPSPDAGASESSANIPSVVAADGGEIPLESWSLSELSQASLDDLPGISPFDSHNIPETTGARIKAITFAFAYLRQEMDISERNEREMRNVIEHVLDGAHSDTVDEYIDKLVERGIVYRHPLCDDMLEGRFDKVVQQTFENLHGVDYVETKRNGNLPTDWDELLPRVWSGERVDAYYLDEERYFDACETLINGLRKSVIKGAKVAGEEGEKRYQKRVQARKYTLRHVLRVVDSRTWLTDRFSVDTDSVFVETVMDAEDVEDAARDADGVADKETVSELVSERLSAELEGVSRVESDTELSGESDAVTIEE